MIKCIGFLVVLIVVVNARTTTLTTWAPINECPVPGLDILFVLDHSGSISDNDEGRLPNWTYMTDMLGLVATALQNKFPNGSMHYAAISYGDSAEIEFNLAAFSDTLDLVYSLRGIPNTGGNTNTTGALRLARRSVFGSELNRPASPDVLVLITDGMPSRRFEAAGLMHEVQQLKAFGVRIIGVGVTTSINTTLMLDIVSYPPADYFGVRDFTSLAGIVDDLLVCITTVPSVATGSIMTSSTLSAVSTASSVSTPTSTTPTTTSSVSAITTSTSASIPSSIPTTAQTSTTPPATTASTTSPTLSGSFSTTPSTTITSTPTSSTLTTISRTTSTTETTSHYSTSPTSTTTLPPLLGYACRLAADVVILMDASGGGLHFNDFRKVRSFVGDLVEQLSAYVDADRLRVGLLRFADGPVLSFDLNAFRGNSQAMVAAIRGASYIGGGTSTGLALNFARTQMFVSSAGDRATHRNFILLVTAGPSNNRQLSRSESIIARRSGIEIVAVAIYPDRNSNFIPELEDIASPPATSTIIQVPTTDQLDLASAGAIRNETLDLLCNNVDDCSSNPCQHGAVCIDGLSSYRCQCADGYAGPNCNATCIKPVDVVLAADVSGSVSEYVQNYTEFLRRLVIGLNANSRVGFVVFSDNAGVQFQLNRYSSLAQVETAIEVLSASGSSNTADAIRVASVNMFTAVNGDRASVPNYLVLITDGKSDNTTLTAVEAARARNNAIIVLAVGIGTDVDTAELRSIASEPISATLTLTGSDGSTTLTTQAVNSLLNVLCQNVDGCDSGPCLNGGTCTSLPGGNFRCSCTTYFTGLQCERGCSAVLDVIFVVDISGSTRLERFDDILDFLQSIVESFEIAPNKTRVGVVTFSDDAHIEFYLDDYWTTRDVSAAIQSIYYTGGKTNIAAALRTLIDVMYLPQNGGRPEAQRLTIFYTDGVANVDTEHTFEYAIDARNKGILILMIGVGYDIDIAELRSIASRPFSRNLFVSMEIRYLPTLLEGLINATCNNVDDCVAATATTCENGGTCVDRYGDFECICPVPYAGKQCRRLCAQRQDVVFIVDLSDAIDDAVQMINFLQFMVFGLPIASDQVRVALVTYSDQPNIQIFLNNYTTSAQVLNALVLSRPRGTANTAAALTVAAQTVFSASYGARASVPHVAVVVTGGLSADLSATAAAAQHARSTAIEIYVVAYGSYANPIEITAIASPGALHVVPLGVTNDAVNASTTLLDRLCHL